MTHRRALLLLVLAAGCRYQVRPPLPPADEGERRHAESAACARGVLPRWLDDDAVNAAIDTDRREAQASVANDAFHGGTFTAQPPSARSGSRAAVIFEDRRAFQQWCDVMKKRSP